MATIVATNNMVKELTNQMTIDSSKISPLLGVNVKLTNSNSPSSFFVGSVTRLVPAIQNANSVVFSAMVLDGVDNTGTRRTITITIDELNTDSYSGYNRMFYTKTLQDQDSAIIYVEEDDDLIISNVSINVFDTDHIKLGNLVSCKRADGTEVEGAITAISPRGESISVSAVTNNRTGTVVLTLIDATTDDFVGAVLTVNHL